MRGRKPKPTALKVLAGNPGCRPLNDREPSPGPGIPTCPDHLHKPARKEWDRITVELGKMGLLAQADRAAIAAYCAAYGRWVSAENQLKRGVTYKANGMIKVHPAVRIAHDALTLMRQYLTEFGLSPASRTRIRAPENLTSLGSVARSAEDPMEEFLRRA